MGIWTTRTLVVRPLKNPLFLYLPIYVSKYVKLSWPEAEIDRERNFGKKFPDFFALFMLCNNKIINKLQSRKKRKISQNERIFYKDSFLDYWRTKQFS